MEDQSVERIAGMIERLDANVSSRIDKLSSKIDDVVESHNDLRVKVAELKTEHNSLRERSDRNLGELWALVRQLQLEHQGHLSADTATTATKDGGWQKITWAVGLIIGLVTIAVSVIVQLIAG